MKLRPFVILAVLLTAPASLRSAETTPPAGFRAIFNGQDLSGWYGLNPHNVVKLEGEKREASLQKMRDEFASHWRVENGELVNIGTGPYATTQEEFGDIELLIEYKTVAKADSGIYLRGTPQVQIWDSNQPSLADKPDRNPNKGSGGLFNNTPKSPGRDPLVLADKPFGEWNAFRIRQVGARTWVWLNDKLVVDGAGMENFWDRGKPLPARGPIMLQTHGGEIRWRNLFVREIAAEEASRLLAQTETASAESAGMRSLFNGKDLSGWDGDPRLWSVKDGVIRGETTAENPAEGNTFLIWKDGQTKDFELRLSFRSNAANNSGIQYRSKHITDGKVRNQWVVRGYQHEIRNEDTLPSVSGFIYDEGGKRGRVCLVGEKAVWGADGKKQVESTLIDAAGYKKLFKLDDWNDVVIIAQGNHIQHYLNNRLILDFTDNDPQLALREGVLAVQLHAGKPMWVEFKDIRIKAIETVSSR